MSFGTCKRKKCDGKSFWAAVALEDYYQLICLSTRVNARKRADAQAQIHNNALCEDVTYKTSNNKLADKG